MTACLISELIFVNYWSPDYFRVRKLAKRGVLKLRERAWEAVVHRRAKVTTRALAALAFAAAAAALVSGCSPGADYPSLVPAVHDMPPPRADTTLDPAQVQQATEDLITARDHLNAEAPPASPDKSSGAAAKTATKAATKPGAKSKPATASPNNDAAAAARTQTAGAESKP